MITIGKLKEDCMSTELQQALKDLGHKLEQLGGCL